MDLTYIPMRHGFLYLVVVLDWATRRVLAWRLSNTMTTDVCLDALEAAIREYGCPGILNTDQGSQFTSTAFVALVQQYGIPFSMDGKGAWRDNLFVERLWKSVKYEAVYLHAYDSVAEAHHGLARYFTFYNSGRPHAALDGRTPDMVYFGAPPQQKAACRAPSRVPLNVPPFLSKSVGPPLPCPIWNTPFFPKIPGHFQFVSTDLHWTVGQ
jgi:putative transposase